MKTPYLKVVFILLVSAFLFQNCKQAVDDVSEEQQVLETDDKKISSRDIAAIEYTEYALSDAAVRSTEDWIKFNELLEQLEVLKSGDLSFFKNDRTLLDGFLKDLTNEIPQDLNEPSVIVRLTALKTSIYKLEESANLQREPKEAVLENIKAVLVAHTNLIFQINKKLEKESQDISKPN